MNAFAIASAKISRAGIQGTFHRLYDVDAPGREPCLLRVAAIEGAPWTELMALECGVMAELRGAGFPIPECEHRQVSARGVHLVERAAGTSLSRFDDDEARMLMVLTWVARLLARLHRIRGNGFGPLGAQMPPFTGVHGRWDDYIFLRLEDHLLSCEAGGAITPREAGGIAALFVVARPKLGEQPSTLLHGDPGSHNFMIDEMAIRAVIDWEDALLGDPLFDLASLCTFHPQRRHAAIWSAYGAILEPGGEAWNRFWLYFLRIALAKTVHRYRFAYADRPDRPPASQRIQLALKQLDHAR